MLVIAFRYFVRLKALVKNRAHPEGSIAEGYRNEECMTFCSRFIEGTTRFTRPSRNPEVSDKIKDMYLFDSAEESIRKASIVAQLSDTTRRGTPSKNRKYCLSLAKNQSQRTTTRSRQILRFARGLRRGLRRKAKALCPADALSSSPSRRCPLTEAPPRKASDGIPILRFAQG